jgi:hypothetical protein
MSASINLKSRTLPKISRYTLDMLSFGHHPKFTFGGYLVGQNFNLNQVKVFSIGKNFPSIPSAVGTWLGECQKALRKSK